MYHERFHFFKQTSEKAVGKSNYNNMLKSSNFSVISMKGKSSKYFYPHFREICFFSKQYIECTVINIWYIHRNYYYYVIHENKN